MHFQKLALARVTRSDLYLLGNAVSSLASSFKQGHEHTAPSHVVVVHRNNALLEVNSVSL